MVADVKRVRNCANLDNLPPNLVECRHDAISCLHAAGWWHLGVANRLRTGGNCQLIVKKLRLVNLLVILERIIFLCFLGSVG